MNLENLGNPMFVADFQYEQVQYKEVHILGMRHGWLYQGTAPKLLQDCFRTAPGLLQNCSKTASGTALGLLQNYFGIALELLRDFFGIASGLLQNCTRGTGSMVHIQCTTEPVPLVYPSL